MRPYQYNHRGARDADETPTVLTDGTKLLPHLGNLTRNVVIRSETPSGTRGHTAFLHHSDVRIAYVQFRDLGRTKAEELNTTTNVKGRYPLHIHHLWGPANLSNTGYQFELIGNAVIDSLKWPIALHGSHYGLIQGNVVFGGDELTGAGISLEDGSETENRIEGNFVAVIRGNVNPRDTGSDTPTPGSGGECFWAAGFNNRFIDNVASDCRNPFQQIVAGPGFKFFAPSANAFVEQPDFRGAQMDDPDDTTTMQLQRQPLLEFRGNEVYGGSATGFTAWDLGTSGYDEDEGPIVPTVAESIIEDFRVWHVYESAAWLYPVNHLTIEGLAYRQDPDGMVYWEPAVQSGDYRNIDLTIRGGDIHAGAVFGGTEAPVGTILIENVSAVTRDYAFQFVTPETPGTGAGIPDPPGITVLLKNNVVTAWPGEPLRTIAMGYQSTDDTHPNVRYDVYVEDYQGVPGEDFRVYWLEQATLNIAGGLAPCSDTTTHPEIFGITCEPGGGGGPADTTPPSVSITAPAANATLSGSVTVSASASDDVGVVGVQFLLDGAPLGAEDTTPPFSASWDTTGVANGGHYALSARARDAAGNQRTSIAVNVTVNNTTTSGLVAAYSFDENTGTTAADSTGLGHTGAIDGATWTNSGKFGAALTFDGVDDWVTVSDANALDLTDGMTLEAWVYPTAISDWRNVIIKERSGGEVYNLYANADTDAPVAFVIEAAQPGTPQDVRDTSQLPLNTWSHLAVTFDDTTLRLYVNGVEVDDRAVSGPLLTSTGELRIGGNSVWGEFFQGRIDEVRIYNRALNATEIGDDMVAGVGPSDTAPPERSAGQPSGTFPAGTTQTTLSLTTNENATCRFGTTAGLAFGALPTVFGTTGGTSHSTLVTGLTYSTSYSYYIKCRDASNNANNNDFVISFAIAAPVTANSTFPGTESPLSEVGAWDSPGSWADLQKNNGAFTTGLNAMARRITPTMTADQYSEITYDQDPGSASWAGVSTRIQSGSNGSGYLAIAFAGEVRLYRADDSGSLTFTQLAAATVSIGTSPRRLRLESEGNTHRVLFNGTQVISHNASAPLYSSGQPGIAASVFGGPQVKILSFEGGNIVAGAPDLTPPTRINGLPTGTFPYGTTQATLSLTTNENATCRYATSASIGYGSMTNTFSTTGTTSHSHLVTGLTGGATHTFYVRCRDAVNNTNTDDLVISFAVADPSSDSSTFTGTESPLSESGMWDTPGTWDDLQKNSGAFSVGLNGGARMVAPAIGADQYAEITYDQDPGAASWVGVTTRIQGASNGSGYLAIAYDGEVRLYRTDDSGTLNFTLLASASVSIGSAPRRLRLESEGNTHRVFFNGTQVLSHNATGTLYATGQPGIAASVFGGPQVKILSFDGGDLQP